jgi:hypothetical protein
MITICLMVGKALLSIHSSNVLDSILMGMLGHKENVEFLGTNTNQRMLVQNLQHRHDELKSQVSSLKSQLLTIEKQSSVNMEVSLSL